MALPQTVSGLSGMVALSKLRHLAQVELFRDVPLSSLRYFLLRCKEYTFEPGEVILDPAMQNDRLYVILSGEATVHLNDLHGHPIAELVAGECFGEMSAFDATQPSAFIRARQRCHTLTIERDTLWAMINFSHGVARNLLALLARRLRVNNQTMSLVQRERDLHQEEANRDGLTGVYNRRWLDSLSLEADVNDPDGSAPMSVIMLDVDHFKRFNDDHGHAAGDAVLRAVAGVLRGELRPQDRVARYGGEEFVVVLPRTSRAGAARVAERLREQAERMQVMDGDDALPPVTISLGVAQWQPGQTLAGLIGVADEALYASKHAGRNRVTLAPLAAL